VDLARVSGVSLNAIKQLEQNPPNKHSTWERDWRGRISAWIPLFGHAFQDVLACKALAKCPPHVLNKLRQDYADWATTARAAHELLRADLIETRRMQLFADAQAHAYRHDWEKAEKLAARATRMFAKDDARWLFHKAFEASCRVYKGDLDGAEAMASNAVVEYDLAAAQAGKQPDPQSKAHAQLVQAWSSFNRGHWQAARLGFELAIQVGQHVGDTELLNTGLHMRARIALEQDNLETAFGFAKRAITAPTVFAHRLKDLENAQSLVSQGCVEDAYGTWYIGVVTSVSGDLAAGRRLIERSAHLLHDNGLTVAAIRQPQISLIHNTLRSSAWDAETYKAIEFKLREMLPQFAQDRSPYANALAMLTLAYTRLLRDARPIPFDERKATADWLCLGLLAHPYSEHLLWQIGIQLLRRNVLPNLYAKECKRYAQTISDRVEHSDPPFHYLGLWGCNAMLRPAALSHIAAEFTQRMYRMGKQTD
jgi:hypothetical protein